MKLEASIAPMSIGAAHDTGIDKYGLWDRSGFRHSPTAVPQETLLKRIASREEGSRAARRRQDADCETAFGAASSKGYGNRECRADHPTIFTQSSILETTNYAVDEFDPKAVSNTAAALDGRPLVFFLGPTVAHAQSAPR